MTRYLGVDYGTKRVGLAISDGLGLTARPLQVVARTAVVKISFQTGDLVEQLLETTRHVARRNSQ